ncbi:MAG: hypothetical protein N2999_03400 [Proteobacteria bacterium]|nr:hypothetical protein [Pseudomonadota bacterium]
MIKDKKKIFLFLLIVINLIFYAKALTLGFVWDDIPQIINNETVKNFKLIDIFTKDGESGIVGRESKTPYYRPVFLLSLAIDFLFFNDTPSLFHLTNIIFHVLLTIVLFLTLQYFFKDDLYAFIGTLIVSIYPARSEAVVYVSARLHILGGLFSLLTFYFLKKQEEENNKKFYYLSVFTYLLAVFSIEMTIFLPVFIIFEQGFYNLRKTLKLLIPHILIIVVYILIRWMVLNRFIWLDVPFPTRFFTGLSTFIKYLEISLFPFNLKVFYENFSYFKKSFDLNVLAGLVVLLSLFYGLWVSARKNRNVFLGLLWFFLTFFFVSNIPYIMYPSLISERYLYIPLIGLSFLIPEFVKLFVEKIEKKQIFIFSFIIIFSIPGFYTIYKRMLPYEDNHLFWLKAVESAPTNTYALDQLAQVYLGKEDYLSALMVYDKITQISPGDYDNYTKIGNFYLRFNDYITAEIYYNKALELSEYDEAYWGLARVNLIKNNTEKAKEYLNRAIKISPHKKKYRDMLQGLN